MHRLVQILTDVGRHCHIGTQEFEGTGKAVLVGILRRTLIAQAAVGLRHGDILIELVAILVFHNNLYRTCTRADTDSLDGNQHVLVDRDFTIGIARIVGIHAEVLSARQQRLVHQQLTGLVDIAQIGQRRNTALRIAIVVKRAPRLDEIIGFAIFLAGKVNMYATVGQHIVTLIDHDAMAQNAIGDLLLRGSIMERADQQVILVGNHHEAHADFPVAHAVVTEVLAHEVRRLCLGRIMVPSLCHVFGALCLNNIRIVLCHCCRQDKRCCNH